jgi:hypothetical protein
MSTESKCNNKYSIHNESITDMKLQWVTALMDYIRNTSVPLFDHPANNDLQKIVGYVLLYTGTFGVVIYCDTTRTHQVIFAHHYLGQGAFNLFISYKNEERHIKSMTIPTGSGDIPDLYALNNELKNLKLSSVYKAYINSEICNVAAIPPSSFAGSIDEWASKNGFIRRIHIKLEV